MTIRVPQDDGHADLGSHDTFVNGPPLNTFARLRRDDPLSWSDWTDWSDWTGGQGYWSVTRHADIFALIGKPDLLSSARGIRIEDQTY